MSTTTLRLPRATAGTVALVTSLGVGALAVTRPVLGTGFLAGVALGTSVRGLGRSPWWTATAAAALPLGATGVIWTVGLSGSVLAAAVAGTAVTVGVSLVSLLAGRLSSAQLSLLVPSGAASALALLLLWGPITAAAAGTTTGGFDALVSPGTGDPGFGPVLLLAGGLLAVLSLLLPAGLRAALRGQPLEFPQPRPLSPAAVAAGTVGLFVALGLARILPGVGPAVGAVVTSELTDDLLAAVVAVEVLALPVVLVLAVWPLGKLDFSVVALWGGSLFGAATVATLAVAVGAVGQEAGGAILPPAAVSIAVFGAILLAGGTGLLGLLDALGGESGRSRRFYTRGHTDGYDSGRTTPHSTRPALSAIDWRDLFRADRVVSFGLVGAAVLVALGMDSQLRLGQTGVVVAVAGALFVQSVVARGRAATRDTGVGNVSALTQFIWVGWTATLAGVGVIVAAGGILAAGVLPTPVSVPATAGVLLALTALGTALWLLSR